MAERTGRYIDSKQACATLGIRPQTLYAYVSRGLIRSEPASGTSRTRRYHREDVDRLAQRKQLRADPSQAALAALRTGEPVLESGLTLITEDGVFYRGVDAGRLARERTIEEVAALLWTGRLEAVAEVRCPTPGLQTLARCVQANLPPLQKMQALLPVAASMDPAAPDLQPSSVCRAGWRILHLMAGVACGEDVGQGGIAQALRRAWLSRRSGADRLLEAALILCADHELNVSAFTARCVASSGASPYAVVQAALAALQGFRHGGASQQLEAMWRELEAEGDARRVVTQRLERGDRLPGFGHAVYRDVDPRAELLLDMVDEVFPGSEAGEVARELRDVVGEVTGLQCNVDLALATLRRAADLPDGSALVLFALGRMVGWTAHAIEQYGTGALIRPRASYVGPYPTWSRLRAGPCSHGARAGHLPGQRQSGAPAVQTLLARRARRGRLP